MGRERIEGGGRDRCTFLNYIEGKPSPSPKAVTVLILCCYLNKGHGFRTQAGVGMDRKQRVMEKF